MPPRHQLENQNWSPFPNIPPTPYQLTTQTVINSIWYTETTLELAPINQTIKSISIEQILGILNNELVEIETPNSEPYYYIHLNWNDSIYEHEDTLNLIANHEQYWEVIRHCNPTEHEFLTRPPIYALGPEIKSQIITAINIYNAHNL